MGFLVGGIGESGSRGVGGWWYRGVRGWWSKLWRGCSKSEGFHSEFSGSLLSNPAGGSFCMKDFNPGKEKAHHYNVQVIEYAFIIMHV